MPDLPYRSLRILLVEDDDLQRELVVEMLVFMGHDVLSAGTGEEALQLLETEAVSVLVADVGLPGMSGIDLANEIHRRDASIAIVFTTGKAYLLCEPLPFTFSLVSKPFHYSALQDTLARLPATSSQIAGTVGSSNMRVDDIAR